jgi:hypothetical protein
MMAPVTSTGTSICPPAEVTVMRSPVVTPRFVASSSRHCGASRILPSAVRSAPSGFSPYRSPNRRVRRVKSRMRSGPPLS